MNDLSSFAHLLAEPVKVMQDLEETETILHSTKPAPAGKPAPGEITFAVRKTAGSPSGTSLEPEVKLASLRSHKTTLKEFHDAGEKKRGEMWERDFIQLYSIIIAEYRPGPAFLQGHLLDQARLTQRIEPGGPKWADVVKGTPYGTWARHAVRLDAVPGGMRGSGTIMADGRILTARHVVYGDGALFGFPPSPDATALASFNRLVGATDLRVELKGFGAKNTLDYCWIDPPTTWPDDLQGTEFGNNTGLPMQKTPLSEAELRNLRVAVIGHPGEPVPDSDDAKLAPQVFSDAPYRLKRFMPGRLVPEQPLVEKNGVTYLRHDCSSLGGASGSLLVNLDTGVIIGVHYGGKNAKTAEEKNRAVPTWLIA
jgi:hypothetical protein